MIQLIGITKSYRVHKGEPVKALDGVDLTLPDKGLVFILGKSGSGKSTLLNILGGLDGFDEGDLILFGKSAKTFTMKDYNSYRSEYVGFIFQEYNLLSHQTVAENVAMALQIQGVHPDGKRIERILSRVGMLALKDRRPEQLSGGQKQRVAIARALVKKPKVILADEPTGALDSENTKEIFNLLEELAKECLVVCVTHDGTCAQRYADRIVRLKEGKVIGDYTKRPDAKRAIDGSENVYHVGKGLLEIPHPQKLVAQDLEAIKERTKDNPGEAYYAYGDKIALPIDLLEGDESESVPFGFSATEKKDILVDEKASYRSNNAHLPFKTIFKMGAENISHGVVRLCMTILLSILAFSMLGVVSSLSSFDAADTFASSGDLFQQDAMAIKKTYHVADESANVGANPLSESDYRKIGEAYPSAMPAYRAPGISFESALLTTDFEGKGNLNMRSGLVLESKEQAFYEDYGFTLLGSPASERNDVVLTNYYVEVFDRAGVHLLDGDLPAGTVTAEKLLGRQIVLSASTAVEPFTITGILQTDLDVETIEEAYADKESLPTVPSRSSLIKNYYVEGPAIACYLSPSAFEDESLQNALLLSTKTMPYVLVPSTSKGELRDIYDFSEKRFALEDGDKTTSGTIDFVGKSYDASTPVMTGITTSSFTSGMHTFSTIGIYAAIALGIVSILITMNYMFTSISFKKQEIGVLKGLGARSTDIFGIFAIQALLLGLFDFALSALLSAGLTSLLDGFFQSFFQVPLPLIRFDWLTAVLLLFVSIFFALFSALIPSYSIASMKPVDAMKRGE